MDDALLKALSNLGQTAAIVLGIVYIAWKVLSRVLERMISAIDGQTKAIDEHTAKDLEHHADVKIAVGRLEGKIEGILDWQERTPVDGPPKRPRTSPGSYYVRRKDDDDGR